MADRILRASRAVADVSDWLMRFSRENGVAAMLAPLLTQDVVFFHAKCLNNGVSTAFSDSVARNKISVFYIYLRRSSNKPLFGAGLRFCGTLLPGGNIGGRTAGESVKIFQYFHILQGVCMAYALFSGLGRGLPVLGATVPIGWRGRCHEKCRGARNYCVAVAFLTYLRQILRRLAGGMR